MDLNSVGNYNQVKSLFCQLDNNRDGRLTEKEISADDIAQLDSSDNNHTVELWEMMEAVNTQRKIDIFNKSYIDTIKFVYSSLDERVISKIICNTDIPKIKDFFDLIIRCTKELSNRLTERSGFPVYPKRYEYEFYDKDRSGEVWPVLSDAILAFDQAGFEPNEILATLRMVIGHAKYTAGEVLQALPAAVVVLKKAGLTSAEITAVLDEIGDGTSWSSMLMKGPDGWIGMREKNYSDMAGALRTISQAVDCLLTYRFQKDQIKGILKVAFYGYRAIPVIIPRLRSTRLSNEQTTGLLGNYTVRSSAPRRTCREKDFLNLPDAVEALFSVGLKAEQIVEIWEITAPKTWGFESLHSGMVNAARALASFGFSGREIYNLFVQAANNCKGFYTQNTHRGHYIGMGGSIEKFYNEIPGHVRAAMENRTAKPQLIKELLELAKKEWG